MAAGLAGLVIDGGVRDTAILDRLGFPIFSNGACIRGTIKDHHGMAFIGKPILIGDVVIQTGDLIVADRDGVVSVPGTRVDDILDKSAQREADESAKIARILAGERTIDIYGWGAGA
jgi:4-hydroxy-4-methyl-2-oxoglutarate aldolase